MFASPNNSFLRPTINLLSTYYMQSTLPGREIQWGSTPESSGCEANVLVKVRGPQTMEGELPGEQASLK